MWQAAGFRENDMRIFLILFCVFVLSSTGTSDELEQRPIAELVEAARQAKDQRDDKKFDEITGQIYERVTGADALTREVPEGVTPAEFDERLCTYRKVTSFLYTPSEIEFLRHMWRYFAYGVAPESEGFKQLQRHMSCVNDNDELVPEAKAMRDGFHWVKKLKAATIDEAREMAREYEALFEKYPDRRQYRGVRIYTSLADLIRRETYEGSSAKASVQFSDEELQFQWDLVQSADNGELAAQIELADRLETGDRFIQGNAKAYFWYKRALQNGGGQSTQNAIDRLHPRLSEFDLALVDYWTEQNNDPY